MSIGGLTGWGFPVAGLIWPTGLTGPSSIRVQLGILIDLDLVIGFLVGQVHPPYKYKGPRPIRVSNRSNTNLFIFFTFYFPISICYSSLVSMAFEDALAGLPSLGQPKVRLPWQGPSRASVHWIFVGLPDKTGLTGLLNQSDRISRRRCKERRCVLHIRVRSCVGPESASTCACQAQISTARNVNAID